MKLKEKIAGKIGKIKIKERKKNKYKFSETIRMAYSKV